MTHDLGFGVGFRPNHYRQVTTTKPRSVDWFEIISENFLGIGGQPLRYLEKLRADYPVVMHGVGLSIAGLDPFAIGYLKDLKALATRIAAPIVSDHLCWTAHGGHNSHDLLPVPFTEKMLTHVASRISFVQEFLQRRLFLENPSAYVGFAGNDMPESEFLAALAHRTGCGILLDLNNLYVNQMNLGLNPIDYLERLAHDAVGQFHLAGHTNRGDVRIDTHDAPVCDAVWDLYQLAAQKWPDVPTLIEWDDKIPEFAVLEAECEKARQVHSRVTLPPLAFPNTKAAVTELSAKAPAAAPQIFADFMTMVTDPLNIAAENPRLLHLDACLPVPITTGINVYNNGYFFRLRDTVQETFPTIAAVCGQEGFNLLISEYLGKHPPEKISIAYAAERFPDYLRTADAAGEFGVPNLVLADIARLEWAKEEVFALCADCAPLPLARLSSLTEEEWEILHIEFVPALRNLQLSCDADRVVDDVEANRTPAKPVAGDFFVLVARVEDAVAVTRLEPQAFALLNQLAAGHSFKDACETLVNQGFSVEAAAGLLVHWCSIGLLAAIR